MEPDRDYDALLLAAADDPEAFAAFYRAHVRGVIAIFRRRVGDAELAADLTAETLRAAALGGAALRALSAARRRTWLYGIARRQLVTFQRRGHVERRARQTAGDGAHRADRRDARARRGGRPTPSSPQVDVALAALPDDQRAAVQARIVEDHDYDEIAAAQAISEPAARQRVSRGLAALRARMSSQEQ